MRRAGVLPVEVPVEVAFHDVDLAQVAWHGHYLKYFENARWALMARIGYSLQDMLDAGEGWPIVDLEVRYIKAARFGDRLVVRAGLVEWETRLVIHYLATRADDGERVARARTVQVAVDMPGGGLRFALPAPFVARVQAALAAAGAGARP
jgi:acyl-CoA thioester hydrolase